MQRTNALQLRRTLGRVLERLERDGEPILVERNREPKAVLISIRDFNERFVDKAAANERERLADELLTLRGRTRRSGHPTVKLLRALRGRLP
jgi:prevent-host-death family protein